MNEKFYIIIDIQSGVINGAIVSKINNNLKIINTVSRSILRRSHSDSTHMIKMMLRSLSEVILKLNKFHNVNSIHIILSSPWVISNSKTVKTVFENERKITDDLITNIIEDASEKKSFEDDIVFIEKNIFEIKMNGYIVSKYNERSTKELSISFATTMSSEKLLNMINNTVKQSFGKIRITYHSSILLNFVSLRKIITDMNNYIYIHIHNELTDLIVVRNGLCISISSFPLGIASLIRRISYSLKQDEKIADSTLSLYQGGKLSELENKRIFNKLEEYFIDWNRHYNDSMDAIKNKNIIPKSIYISAHSHLDIYKENLKKIINDNINFIDLDVDTMSMHILALNDII